MNHDVFISYSSKNKTIADTLCHVLEQHQIKCWIAPRDIPCGAEYTDVIDEAIIHCKLFVIIFSSASAVSQWVKGELNLAFTEEKIIMPYRIDDTPLKGGLRVMLNQKHWLDAYPDAESRFKDLVGSINSLLPQIGSISIDEMPDVEDAFSVGCDYYYGNKGVTDYEKAAFYFRKAAEQGYALAQYNLGVCYDNGRGVKQDYKEAVKWFHKAAEQGYALAQYNLGVCYKKGRGVKLDYAEAVKWYLKAAEQGDADAQFYLGVCYDNGQGVNQGNEEAVKWYLRAADQGYATAQFNLGVCYKNGLGVKQDKVEAEKWFSKAAEQGVE